MRQCGFCGDNLPDEYEIPHDCWVVNKTVIQENLPAPSYEYATCRMVQTDAEFIATHTTLHIPPTL